MMHAYMSDESCPAHKKSLSIWLKDRISSMHMFKRAWMGLIAAITICALGLVIPLLFDLLNSPSSGSFVIKAFTSDREEAMLKPDAPVLLFDYQANMSSLPGYAFVVESNMNAVYKQEIHIQADSGSLIIWHAPDYVAKDIGQSYTFESGDTVYWSPVGSAGTPVDSCNLTVTSFYNDMEIRRTDIEVKQTYNDRFIAQLLSR